MNLGALSRADPLHGTGFYGPDVDSSSEEETALGRMNLDQRGEGYFLRVSTRLDSSVYTERRDKEDTAVSELQGSHYFAIGAGHVIVELPHPLMLRIISHQHAPGGRPARSLLVLLGSATRSWRNLIKTVISGDAIFRITAAHEAVEFLSAFPRATRLKMTGTACPGELCGAFRSSSLTSLDLSGNMSISDISAVAGCVHLRELFLGSTSVSDVSALSACLRLTRLELQHTPVVTLQGLRTLSLETINLDGTRVTAFDGLGPTVRELLASGTQVAEVTEHLAKLTELRKLVLDFTNLTEVGRISRLTRLCSLSLYKTRVSNVAGLSALVALRDLDLSETRVGSVRGLAPLLNMQKLLLYGTPLSSIHGLERMSCLEELRISVTRVSDLTPLALLASLRTLDASNSPLLGTLDGIEGCDMMEVLNLSSPPWATWVRSRGCGGCDVSS